VSLLALIFVSVNTAVACLAQGSDKGTQGSNEILKPFRLGGGPNTDNALSRLKEEAHASEGALFVEPDRIFVKPPVLSSLIEVNKHLSPYLLEAREQHLISLEEVLKIALTNNLDIKITNADEQTQKWLYYSSLGGFLPDLSASVSYDSLKGQYASPFGVIAPINSPYLVMPAAANWTFFKGGGIFFTAREHKHKYRASQYALKGTVNDVLLQATNLYYQLVLNEILLQIRIKALETARAFLLHNQIRFANGAATKLDVLQATTLVAKSKQAQITQQIARRRAAINLATALCLDPSEDLATGERLVSTVRLIDEDSKIGDLIQTAVDNRPELKKYEQLRLAAKDAIKVACSTLSPQVIGSAVTASTGASVTNSAGSSSGSSSASTTVITPGGFATSSSFPTSSGTGAGKKFEIGQIYQIGLSINWTLGGLVLTELGQIQAARWQARRVQLEFAKTLNDIYQQVRDARLEIADAEDLVDATTENVESSRQQVEQANIRLAEGVGTDLDEVAAEKEYTQALIDKANAIIEFNIAQAKLLRAMGVISRDSLLSSKPMRPL
jgi:outer membrane protein